MARRTLRHGFDPTLHQEEQLDARIGRAIWGLLTGVGLAAFLGATFLPPRYVVWTGFAYWFAGPGVPLVIWRLWRGKRARGRWAQRRS